MSSSASTRSESDRYLRQALNGLLSLKLRSGATLDELRAITESCILSASNEAGIRATKQGLDIHRLGSVLRDWHKETKFLASDGNPNPLPLIGKRSVSTLIMLHYSNERVPAVISTLKRAGLIKRSGRTKWVPTGYHARISANSQEILDHVSEGVCRFLETVLNNIRVRNKSKLLFERSCKVRQLPKSKAAAFRLFAHQQAIAFITAIDDWLEARVEQSTSKRAVRNTCSAGVFTFAYLDPFAQSGKKRK